MIHRESGPQVMHIIRGAFEDRGIEYPSFLLSFSSFSDLPLSYEVEIVEEKEMRLVAQFTKRNRC